MGSDRLFREIYADYRQLSLALQAQSIPGVLFGKDVDELPDFCSFGEPVSLPLVYRDDQVFRNLLAARELAQRVEVRSVLQAGLVQHSGV